jgi:hypothetical protein
VLDFARKGLHPIAIHRDIMCTFGPDAVSYSSVTHSLHHAEFAFSNPVAPLPEQEHPADDCDQAVLSSLTD